MTTPPERPSSSERRTGTERAYRERVLRVLLHLEAHLDEPVDLERLARLADFSPFHFHRVFRGVVGEPVVAHVRRLRLERAATRLATGDRSVTEVALEAGFEAPEAFTRAFRARFGASPRAYRAARTPLDPRAATRAAAHHDQSLERRTLEPRTPNPAMNARTVTLEPVTVAFLRHVGPYTEVGALWGRMIGWAGQRGLFGPDARTFGLCYDDPEVTPAEKLRYDACFVVEPGFRPEGDVAVQELPRTRYAVATHVGPYERLAETYGELVGTWMPSQDLVPAAGRPSLEVYVNDPRTTPPEELRTEVHFPIEEGVGGTR